MNRLFTWFLPKWDPTLEIGSEKPVRRMDLAEAATHRVRLKNARYSPVHPQNGGSNG